MLKDFIYGFLFAFFITPILDSFGSVIMTFFEMIKGNMAVKVAEYNNQISLIGEEPTNSYVIGFQAPDPEEDEYEED